MFGISETTAGKVFNVMVRFLCYHLQEITTFVPGDVVRTHMPQDFARKHPRTVAIMDPTGQLRELSHYSKNLTIFSAISDEKLGPDLFLNIFLVLQNRRHYLGKVEYKFRPKKQHWKNRNFCD